MMTKTVGINGFGRIGRAVFKKIMENDNLTVAVINDVNPDKNNLAYGLKYDSTYGTLDAEVKANELGILVNGKQIYVYHEKDIDMVPWEKHNVVRIIDASGIFDNMLKARLLKNRGILQCVFTRSAEEPLSLDKSIIVGVNEKELNVKKDFIISSSICDAVAFCPVMALLHENFGIRHGQLTTLHPWLPNQRLLDGPSVSWSRPGHIHAEYVQGRAAPHSIIPKPTSAISASCKVLNYLEGKFESFSYRTPTSIVSSACINVQLEKETNTEAVAELFQNAEKTQKYKLITNNYEPLVSIDFRKNEYAAIIDQRWTHVNNHNYLRLVLWYDNEWGYSCKVVDLVNYLFSLDDQPQDSLSFHT